MSLTTFEDDDVDYEDEAALLKNNEHDDFDSDALPRKPTPLPKVQFSVLLSLWVAEAVVDNSISPYLNQVRMASAGWLERDYLSCLAGRPSFCKTRVPCAEYTACSSSENYRFWAAMDEKWATTQGS
jgi:hypothetical protein